MEPQKANMRNFDNDNILMVYVKVALDTFNPMFMALEIVIMEEMCSGKFIRPPVHEYCSICLSFYPSFTNNY